MRFQLTALDVQQGVPGLDDHVGDVSVADLCGVEAHAELIDVLLVQFQFDLAGFIGHFYRFHVHAAAVRRADDLLSLDVLHQFRHIRAAVSGHNYQIFCRVLQIVGQPTGHKIVVIDQRFHRLQPRNAFTVVVDTKPRQEPQSLEIGVICVLLLVQHMGTWIRNAVFCRVQRDRAAVHLGIRPRLRVVHDKHLVRRVPVHVCPLRIPVQHIVPAVRSVLAVCFDNRQRISTLERQLSICVHIGIQPATAADHSICTGICQFCPKAVVFIEVTVHFLLQLFIFGNHDPVTVAEQVLDFLICQFREKRV